jgi:hypothetical protein
LLEHRSAKLRWKSLREALPATERRPVRLRRVFEEWRGDLPGLCAAPPTLAMAVVGQAAVDERISPKTENRLLTGLLRHWALRRPLPPEVGGLECKQSIASLADRRLRRTAYFQRMTQEESHAI